MSRKWHFFLAVLPAIAFGSSALAADNDRIERSIKRGVAFLKQYKPDPVRRGYPVACDALVGLTLLETGTAATDARVEKLADSVRHGCPDLTHTYSVALAILFLDRLNDANDVPLIQALGNRLLLGQNQAGGWSYYCGNPRDAEIKRLRSLLQQRMPNPVPGEGRPGGPPRKPPPRHEPPEGKDKGDNSNTQFALMGLWKARRHGVQADKGLTAVEQRFRKSQNKDGGWSYIPGDRKGSTASMTCVGLLGLAMHHVALKQVVLRTEARPPGNAPAADPGQDRAIRNGLLALGTVINPNPRSAPVNHRIDCYFLWSLERVAVAYGLNTIGEKDWHAWGARMLLAKQDNDGSWPGFSPEVETCFALLFLRKANLTQDISASLTGKVTDPGKVVLRGSRDLMKPPPVVKEKPAAKPVEKTKIAEPKLSKPATEAERLTQALVKASATEQAQLLGRYRDAKGTDYTDALASAIPQLGGNLRSQARDALADRLTRMKAATLRNKMKETDPEIRIATALACGMKEDQAFVPDLIALLEDREDSVVRAARVSLKSLTSQDFGPLPGASTADRGKAVTAWKNWYLSH